MCRSYHPDFTHQKVEPERRKTIFIGGLRKTILTFHQPANLEVFWSICGYPVTQH